MIHLHLIRSEHEPGPKSPCSHLSTLTVSFQTVSQSRQPCSSLSFRGALTQSQAETSNLSSIPEVFSSDVWLISKFGSAEPAGVHSRTEKLHDHPNVHYLHKTALWSHFWCYCSKALQTLLYLSSTWGKNSFPLFSAPYMLFFLLLKSPKGNYFPASSFPVMVTILSCICNT